MKGKSEGNLQDVFFIVEWSVSAHMFLLQALGRWRYRARSSVSITMKQISQPVNSKTQQKITIFNLVLCQVRLFVFNTNLITKTRFHS